MLHTVCNSTFLGRHGKWDNGSQWSFFMVSIRLFQYLGSYHLSDGGRGNIVGGGGNEHFIKPNSSAGQKLWIMVLKDYGEYYHSATWTVRVMMIHQTLPQPPDPSLRSTGTSLKWSRGCQQTSGLIHQYPLLSGSVLMICQMRNWWHSAPLVLKLTCVHRHFNLSPKEQMSYSAECIPLQNLQRKGKILAGQKNKGDDKDISTEAISETVTLARPLRS